MVVLDGRILGVWSYEVVGDAVTVTVEPFARLPKPVREGVEAEAARLAAYLGAGRADVAITAPR